MRIIDFHVHAGHYHLLRDDIQNLLNRKAHEPNHKVGDLFSNPKELDPYLQSFGVVRGMVLAECGPGTNYTINSQMISAFCDHAPMLVPFGSINPKFHDTVHEFKVSVAAGCRGFKFYPADHSFDATTPEMMDVYRKATAHRMPMVFHTGSTAQRDADEAFVNPLEFLPIIEDNPDGVIILAHAGRPDHYDEAFRLAADYGNVWLDTGLTDFRIMRDAIEDDTLGRRILFGSDWPVCGAYGRLLDDIYSVGLSDSALQRLFYDNAMVVLERVGLAAEPVLAAD